MKISEYESCGGREYFLQFVNKDNILFGLLRLRLPDSPFMDELKDSAIVREVHVYGKALKIGKEGIEGQHTGIGKKLMKEAEMIALENGYNKVAVISGVGVREYYRKLDYRIGKENIYMVKNIE